MQWSEQHRELVSSHGFSDNQLCLWKLSGGNNNLIKIREFKSHTARVLHMAKSPDGSQVVSAGADDSLRFWDIFSPNGYNGSGSGSSGSGFAALKGMASPGMGRMASLGGLGGMSMSSGFSLR
jgi:cell division cycle protein 20 (cofactor of APC complex)